jgi:hypothetical protein
VARPPFEEVLLSEPLAVIRREHEGRILQQALLLEGIQ